MQSTSVVHAGPTIASRVASRTDASFLDGGPVSKSSSTTVPTSSCENSVVRAPHATRSAPTRDEKIPRRMASLDEARAEEREIDARVVFEEAHEIGGLDREDLPLLRDARRRRRRTARAQRIDLADERAR